MKNIEQAYTDNYEVVYKYLFANTHNADISEELAQETFYRAIKNINNFKGNSKISTWLCSIAKNLLLAEFKRKNKFDALSENDLIVSEETVFDDDEKILLFKEIQKLDNNTKDVMYLRLSGELTFKEIAEIMDKTENWVRVTYYRGKEKIKGGFKNENF